MVDRISWTLKLYLGVWVSCLFFSLHPFGGTCGPSNCASPGRDGSLNVTSPGTIINTYYQGLTNVPAGTTSITVSLATGVSQPIKAGSLLLIHQTEDSTSATAGQYEYATALTSISTSGGALTVAQPLNFTYTANPSNGQVFQVVLVPQLTDVTVASGASISGLPWASVSGSLTGGIVALDATGIVTLIGDIDASNIGFRDGNSGALAGNGEGWNGVESFTNGGIGALAAGGGGGAGWGAGGKGGGGGAGAGGQPYRQPDSTRCNHAVFGGGGGVLIPPTGNPNRGGGSIHVRGGGFRGGGGRFRADGLGSSGNNGANAAGTAIVTITGPVTGATIVSVAGGNSTGNGGGGGGGTATANFTWTTANFSGGTSVGGENGSDGQVFSSLNGCTIPGTCAGADCILQLQAQVTANCPDKPIIAFGTVSTVGGSSAPGVIVTVLENGTTLATGTTDSNGKFRIKLPPFGDTAFHTLTVEAGGASVEVTSFGAPNCCCPNA